MSAAWDAIVVGGGFAGSVTAAGLARLGMRVCIVDREGHPRFAIGESSTPLASLLLERIAGQYAIDELLPFTSYGRWCAERPAVMRGCKQGFAYLAGGDTADVGGVERLMVAAAPSREVADTQWLRADFDHALFDIARGCGVDAIAPAAVRAWSWDRRSRVWRLRLSDAGGEREITGGLVVDAAGLGEREAPPHWRTSTRAAFAHFVEMPRVGDVLDRMGVDRAEDPLAVDDAVIHVLTGRGWLWLIRFDDGRVSVGFVAPRAEGSPPARSSEVPLAADLPPDPLVRALVAPGRQITPTGRIDRVQWRRRAISGPMFARLPSAAGFVDPLHSTGNAHALAGVLRVLEAARSLAPLQTALDEHHALTDRELDHLDRIIGSSYACLGDMARFEPWSMIYFAAATACEQAIRADLLADVDTDAAQAPTRVGRVEPGRSRKSEDRPGWGDRSAQASPAHAHAALRSDGARGGRARQGDRGGFLLADDPVFAPLVRTTFDDEALHGASAARLHEELGARFARWNRAGLWDPSRRGLYPFIEMPAERVRAPAGALRGGAHG